MKLRGFTWNRAAQRLLGYSEEEAVGQPITIIIAPELHHEDLAYSYLEQHGARKTLSLTHCTLQSSNLKEESGQRCASLVVRPVVTSRRRL